MGRGDKGIPCDFEENAMPELGRINVFYSYAHTDEAYRTRLVEWLGALREEGVISDWHDRKIAPGADWGREIASNLERSHVVLLLISPAFMQSDYSIGVEVKKAIALHWERRCRIVPVIIQPTPGWTDAEFGTFQALPKDAKPVSQWAHQEAAYADIVEGIRKVCKEIVDWENPYRRGTVGDWIETEQTIRVAGQRIVAQARVTLVAKDQRAATAQVVASSAGQQIDQRLRIPLEQPLEDNIQTLLGQFKERIPRTASFAREETGRGEDKLFVGGTPYHCSWSGIRLQIDTGEDKVTFDARTWRCIDVPLDGIVKGEGVLRNEAGQVLYETANLLTAYGHGPGRPARPR
jgi:hypothetical protein